MDTGNFHNVSLGQGQEVVAEQAMDTAAVAGHWVILQVLQLYSLSDLNIKKRKTWKGIMIRNVLKRRRECGTYLATARRHRRRLKMQKRDE